MSDVVIKAEHLSKMYRLGVINNGTLWKDIQTWTALKFGKDDPHSRIGEDRFSGSEDHFWALKDLEFEIHQGDRVGIIGKNGAGKSTLLKILSRVTAPTEGSIKIKGKIASLLEVGTGFNGELTGRENIYLNGAILGMKKRQIDRKLDEIIDFSEIEHHIDTPVKRYSSGMYVRLAFAVAAHLDSSILIADEVLAVGDASFQKKALGKMESLSTGEGRTVLFVSHNIDAVRRLCNKGILLQKGRIIADTNLIDCLKLYSIQQNTTSIWKGNIGDENLQVYELKLLLDGNIEEKLSIQKGQVFQVYIRFEIISPNINYGFSVEIKNNQNFIICESSVSEFLNEKEYNKLCKKGIHEMFLEIDSSILSRGVYSITLDFAISNLKRITHDEPNISFEILDNDQQIIGISNRHDVVVPNWKWSII